MKKLLSILLLLCSPQITWAGCSITFDPHSQAVTTPAMMTTQLMAQGWTVSGISSPITNPNFPTITYFKVSAFKEVFTYVFDGQTKSMCAPANKWEVISNAERTAWMDAIQTELEFNVGLSTLDYLEHGFTDGKLFQQNYTPFHEFSTDTGSFLSNDWVTDPNGFGYTTKDQHSNDGQATSASGDPVIFIDTTDMHEMDAPIALTGHVLNPPTFTTGVNDLFAYFFPGMTHASRMAALAAQVEGVKFNNINVGDNATDGFADTNAAAFEFSVMATMPKPTTPVIVAMPLSGGDVSDDNLHGVKNAAADNNYVIIDGTPNRQSANSDCQIGNYYVYGYDTPIGYHNGRCITRSDYNARFTTPATGFDLYEQITQEMLDLIAGRDLPSNDDNPKTLSVGWYDRTRNVIGSVAGNKTDVMCDFNGFYWQSSSMCTSVVGLAKVIVKEHPDFTAQCVIDTFINSTKAISGFTQKTGSGAGYGIMNADAVIAYANSHGCGEYRWYPTGNIGTNESVLNDTQTALVWTYNGGASLSSINANAASSAMDAYCKENGGIVNQFGASNNKFFCTVNGVTFSPKLCGTYISQSSKDMFLQLFPFNYSILSASPSGTGDYMLYKFRGTRVNDISCPDLNKIPIN